MPDYMFLLESRLSPEQRAALVRVQELAQADGCNVYLTGGAVRDLISGMPIRDLDFTVEGNPARIVRELEKGGARIVSEDERLRRYEVVFHGDVDGSISAARDEVYERPGAKPEVRWSTIMEDLRRRDFSINAIAISLNPASLGLLLDPTNGLADLEKREVRALTMHSFTNQPGRLLRVVRWCARMGFKMEPRTADWFALAIERGLVEAIRGEDVGSELRQLGREDRPVTILKAWAARDLLDVIHPRLAKRLPDYDRLARLMKVRDAMVSAGLRPRLFAAVTCYLFARLGARQRSSALKRMGFRLVEIEGAARLEREALKAVKLLKGRSTAAPLDAFRFIEKLAPHILAFIQTEYKHPKVRAKIRNFLTKWRPWKLGLPVAELEALGVPRGPKFDKILNEFFELQLRGKGRTPQDRTKLLRRLAGIKPEPKKKKPKEVKKKARPAEKAPAAPAPEAPPPLAVAAKAPTAPAAPKKAAKPPEVAKKKAVKTSPRKRPAVKGSSAKRKKRR